MSVTGLLNPKNAAPNTGGGFKEGLIRVDNSIFRVVQPNAAAGEVARGPHLALVWDITRLDENMEPLTDEHDQPIVETLTFGVGGKSLTNYRVGKADGPDDQEIEDLGDKVGTEGPTLYPIQDPPAKINPKSGIHYLYVSLENKYDEAHINHTWAPDHIGLLAHMSTVPGEGTMKGKDGVERPFMMKVVDKVLKLGYENKGSKGAAKGSKVSEAETTLGSILEALSEKLDGKAPRTLKKFGLDVAEALRAAEVDAKLMIPITNLYKDIAWLSKNAKKYDMTVDTEDNTIAFGTPKE